MELILNWIRVSWCNFLYSSISEWLYFIQLFFNTERQEYSHLPEVMSMVAAEEMNSLPDFVQQCSVVYIPEVGYLLAISVWEEDLNMEDLELEGLDYKVSLLLTLFEWSFHCIRHTRNSGFILILVYGPRPCVLQEFKNER